MIPLDMELEDLSEELLWNILQEDHLVLEVQIRLIHLLMSQVEVEDPEVVGEIPSGKRRYSTPVNMKFQAVQIPFLIGDRGELLQQNKVIKVYMKKLIKGRVNHLYSFWFISSSSWIVFSAIL